MTKLFRKFHLWLALPFGIVITLICFSGATLVFEPEITRAIQHDVYYVTETRDSPLPMSELMETVKSTLPDSVAVTGVTVFADKERTYQVNLSKPRRTSVFIDQYSGEITGRNESIGFFSTMFRLHRWLLDDSGWNSDRPITGKLIVGISTILFVITLLTGVAIWWPRSRRSVRKSLTISLRKGWEVFWRNLHVSGGMYALVIVLTMALTGLTWSFEWYRTAFYAACGVENKSASESPGGDKKEMRQSGANAVSDTSTTDFKNWQGVYSELKSANPRAPRITVGSESASVTLGNSGNVRAADKYGIDPASGKITSRTAYADSESAGKLQGWIYSIHTGNIAGVITKVLWMLGALFGATLPLTGYYIWICRVRKKRHFAAKPNQRI